MKPMMIVALSAASLTMAGCGQKNTGAVDTGNNVVAVDTGNDMAVAPATTGGQAFANAAAASDAFEIATSKLALTSSKSAAVKKFAQAMIDAHTDSTAKLKSATASTSPAITPDPTLTSEQQATLDTLKAATGNDFDKAYVAGQTAGHQKTLDTLRNYAATGDVAALKTFATTLTPIVAAHLNMTKSLKV